ncbi:response regulator transcription factor [Clostridium grantii]|uniref:Stage 0 sporulation protein A homolog n=1 Tax=Clostridium grantii DSM 8605 TaxID=1121316 RepID=A0A1M5XLG7_9CLOT|nr:response regulator transcription factor [Clostridium grantii]SHI00103.1 DNA-binding response regulator, OmpR family, contains REC and winged-helix (wHTH) domain [Clostridium grantii DSM 8605]
MAHKILIVEDEIKLARFIQLELKYEGYAAEIETDGRKALNSALENNFDIILLDIMLPSLSGLEVLRRLRQSSKVPVILLTAKDEISDKVTGLDYGADDYITKPFAIEELLARIRVTLRHQIPMEQSSDLYIIEKLQLDGNSYTVTYNSTPIELTKTEFQLLKYLFQNKNIVLSREKIVSKVWGYDYYGDSNIVDVYITYLRNKIHKFTPKKFIHTIRGVGYTLKDE